MAISSIETRINPFENLNIGPAPDPFVGLSTEQLEGVYAIELGKIDQFIDSSDEILDEAELHSFAVGALAKSL
jgi:hypothetical protein